MSSISIDQFFFFSWNKLPTKTGRSDAVWPGSKMYIFPFHFGLRYGLKVCRFAVHLISIYILPYTRSDQLFNTFVLSDLLD